MKEVDLKQQRFQQLIGEHEIMQEARTIYQLRVNNAIFRASADLKEHWPS